MSTSSDPLSSKRTLRDHLLRSLSLLPNTHTLGLTVLSSTPRRINTLFPYTVNHPKAYEREYLITISTSVPTASPDTQTAGSSIGSSSQNVLGQGTSTGSVQPPLSTNTPHDPSTSTLNPDTGTTSGSGSNSSQSSTSPPVLVSALHAYLYTIPSVSTSILYISKLDSSGHGPRIPVTKTLITSFMAYHLAPDTRPSEIVRIHLFARSQGQYLFPNSAKNEGKRVSGGLALCGWWRGVYEDVAGEFSRMLGPSTSSTTSEARNGATNGTVNGTTTGDNVDTARDGAISLRYLLPSYSAGEAAGMLGSSKKPLPPGLSWTYAPPFDSPLFVSTSRQSGETPNVIAGSGLSGMIPSLPDDPKTRFLDELVLDSSSTRRQGGIASTSTNTGTTRAVSSQHDHSSQVPNGSNENGGAPAHILQKRQTEKERAKERDMADRQHAHNSLSRIPPEDFWERMGFRQECTSGDVTGFFALISQYPSSITTTTTTNTTTAAPTITLDTTSTAATTSSAPPTTAAPPQRMDLGIALVDRIHKALLNCDFGSLQLAIEGTSIWLKSVEGIVKDEIGEEGFKGCIGEVKPKEGLPTAATEVAKRKEEVVTMLQPRKKKRT